MTQTNKLKVVKTDNCDEALDFYKQYWTLTISENNLIPIAYSGDVINSFKTILGCMYRLLPRYNGDNKPSKAIEMLHYINDDTHHTFDQETLDLVNLFSESYWHALANMMPLPLKPKRASKLKLSLNQLKGGPDYHDFADLFLKDIRKYYLKEEANTNQAYFEENNVYFNSFGVGLSGWVQFIEKNHLQSFFEDDQRTQYSKLIKLSPSSKVFPYNKKNWMKLNDDYRIQSKEDIKRYLMNAIMIIDLRAKRFNQEDVYCN